MTSIKGAPSESASRGWSLANPSPRLNLVAGFPLRYTVSTKVSVRILVVADRRSWAPNPRSSTSTPLRSEGFPGWFLRLLPNATTRKAHFAPRPLAVGRPSAAPGSAATLWMNSERSAGQSGSGGATSGRTEDADRSRRRYGQLWMRGASGGVGGSRSQSSPLRRTTGLGSVEEATRSCLR